MTSGNRMAGWPELGDVLAGGGLFLGLAAAATFGLALFARRNIATAQPAFRFMVVSALVGLVLGILGLLLVRRSRFEPVKLAVTATAVNAVFLASLALFMVLAYWNVQGS